MQCLQQNDLELVIVTVKESWKLNLKFFTISTIIKSMSKSKEKQTKERRIKMLILIKLSSITLNY